MVADPAYARKFASDTLEEIIDAKKVYCKHIFLFFEEQPDRICVSINPKLEPNVNRASCNKKQGRGECTNCYRD